MDKKVGYISLIGRPNVGKSTLLNKLIGKKISITSPTVQTTRNTISGIKNTPEAQIVFLDTPGFHKPYDKMGSLMNKEALSTMYISNIICILFPIDEYSGTGDKYIIYNLKDNLENKIVFCLITKIDKEKKEKILTKISYFSKLYNFDEIIPISCKNNVNLNLLEEKFIEYIPFGNEIYNNTKEYLAENEFFIKEFIREKIYIFIKHEVPHSTFINIDSIDEDDNDLYVKSTIYVEREGQKAIIIGKKGSMIKKIRIQSQKDIANHFNKKTFLDIVVKVKDKWRKKNLFTIEKR